MQWKVDLKTVRQSKIKLYETNRIEIESIKTKKIRMFPLMIEKETENCKIFVKKVE